MRNYSRHAKAAMAGILTGITIFGISISVIYHQTQGILFRRAQFRTVSELRTLDELIIVYRSDKGSLPRHLNEALIHNGIEEEEKQSLYLIDRWGHPYQYQVSGEDYEILSYGQDGVPGGRGLNADISSKLKSLRSSKYEPTLTQFIFELPTKGILVSCILSGIAGCVLAIRLMVREKATRPRIWETVCAMVVTIACSIILAGVMSFHHLPLGH